MEPEQSAQQAVEAASSWWESIYPYISSDVGKGIVSSLATIVLAAIGRHLLTRLSFLPSRHEKRLPEANVCLEYDRDEQRYMLKAFDLALNDIMNIGNAVFIFMILSVVLPKIGFSVFPCGLITGFIVAFCLYRLVHLSEDIKLIIYYRNKTPKV